MNRLRLTFLSRIALPLLTAIAAIAAPNVSAQQAKGVVFVLVDDMGYGDIDALYPSSINTPHIDDLVGESVRLTDYHGAPLCTPARSMLMTGRYSEAAGAWHTVTAREFLHADEQTMGDVFKANGWNTGVFGKWHIGKGYPFSPQYRGFDTTVIHGAGAVGTVGDYWGNDYYSGVDASGNPTTPDVYEFNGELLPAAKYATDVWFNQAQNFIQDSVNDNKPFFAYIPTNVLHKPLNAPYLYKNGLDGMIENLDDNLFELDAFLDDLGIKDDVLLVIGSDNGGLLSVSGRDGGLRGGKASVYDGGHRIPMFMRWRNGDIGGTNNLGRDVDWLVTATDILPTFIDLLDLNRPNGGKPFDGYSLADAITDDNFQPRRRHHVVTYQQQPQISLARVSVLDDHVKRGVIKHKWRLVRNTVNAPWELYDVLVDRAQQNNLAGVYPEVVATISAKFDDWWENDVGAPEVTDYEPMVVDSRFEDELFVHSHFWLAPVRSPLTQAGIAANQTGTGTVPVRFEEGGRYRFEMRRWPREDGGAIRELSNTRLFGNNEVALSQINAAQVTLENFDSAQTSVSGSASFAVVEMEVPAGHEGFVTAEFLDGNQVVNGVYFLYISRVGAGSGGNTGGFVPDPNKLYHIDNPAHGRRLAARSGSEELESRTFASTGGNTQWRFVQSATPGLWHIDRAAGGSTPRIRTDLSLSPDMQATSSSGDWTRFSIEANPNRPGTYLLTTPLANTENQRLRLLGDGTTDFSTNNNVGNNPSFVFTEVN